MLIDAAALCALGLITVLLPLSGRYRSHLVHRLSRRTGGEVPADQVPALEARATRRARAGGGGVLLSGFVWTGVALLWPEGAVEPSGGYVVISLACVSGAGGLALVEVLRPGAAAPGPRLARTRSTTAADYLPPQLRALHWAFVLIGLAGLAVTFGVSRSRWFDAETILRSPAMFLLAGIPVVVLLSQLAVRRVLAAPRPARDHTELFWRDAVRADTLATLTLPPALVSLLALTVAGATLDDAASAAAVASGQVGPAWSLWLLIGGYLLPFLLVVGGVAVVAATAGRPQPEHFRQRLWPAGQPARPSTGTA